MNYFTLIMIVLAAISNAFMDKVYSHWGSSIWKKLNAGHWFYRWAGPGSWKNKWKNGDPVQGARFFLSTTVLVWVTDFWHFMQFMWIKLILLAIVLSSNYQPLTQHWLSDFTLYWITYSFLFEIWFGFILSKKK